LQAIAAWASFQIAEQKLACPLLDSFVNSLHVDTASISAFNFKVVEQVIDMLFLAGNFNFLYVSMSGISTY